MQPWVNDSLLSLVKQARGKCGSLSVAVEGQMRNDEVISIKQRAFTLHSLNSYK